MIFSSIRRYPSSIRNVRKCGISDWGCKISSRNPFACSLPSVRIFSMRGPPMPAQIIPAASPVFRLCRPSESLVSILSSSPYSLICSLACSNGPDLTSMAITLGEMPFCTR